jgi:hypothetical protein
MNLEFIDIAKLSAVPLFSLILAISLRRRLFFELWNNKPKALLILLIWLGAMGLLFALIELFRSP